MVGTELLAYIWSGAIELRSEPQQSVLGSLLDSVLTVPTICLVSKSGLEEPVAFADTAEVAPGVQLGDVLAEELDIDVPINSIILIEPDVQVQDGSVNVVQLGRNLGQLLEAVATASNSTVQTSRPSISDLASKTGPHGVRPEIRSVGR